MNQGWVYTDRITAAEAGLSVLEFYTSRYRHSSQAEWRDRILSGQIRSGWPPRRLRRSPPARANSDLPSPSLAGAGGAPGVVGAV
jgi:hypothetical protein